MLAPCIDWQAWERMAEVMGAGARAAGGNADGGVSRPDDAVLLDGLRAGDERAFLDLVQRYHRAMVRMALAYVPTAEAAEEVVQDTWIAVLSGVGGFEGRSSVRTWIFRIVTYQAMTRGRRERRSIPFSALAEREAHGVDVAVDPARFQGPDGRYPGGWVEHPDPWGDGERIFLGLETQAVVASALEALPPAQRLVMTLRDVEGWTSGEVCEALEISAGNQRVLLHRARSKVRAAVERYQLEAAV